MMRQFIEVLADEVANEYFIIAKKIEFLIYILVKKIDFKTSLVKLKKLFWNL